MFATTAKNIANTKLTENGAIAYSTTGKVLTDLFAQIGALRPRSASEIESKFASAFAADPLIATKMLFYCGNIRGGLGERRTFRICLRWLAINHPQVVIVNMANIYHFNRWDSMFELIGTPVENEMWGLIAAQLEEDATTAVKVRGGDHYMSISLLAKWMPTETASSKKTRKLARKAMENLGLSPRQYRKLISALRKYLNVTERAMSTGEWSTIDYPSVPSYAMKNYRKAFARNDAERFAAYKASLVKGEAKVNASTLYPYDLVGEVRKTIRYDYRTHSYTAKHDTIIEEQWKALPNYVSGENNILIMADVSGSMECSGGRPMNTSIGLATYFAQRNKGEYHNLYMTFTNEPHFIALREGATLADAVSAIASTDIGYNTNLEKAFMYILNHAVTNHISNFDLPAALVVVSDMEIDNYARYKGFNFVDEMKARFAAYGYTMPKLVCWNVEARNDTFLSQSNDVVLVSGQSVSTFKNLCSSLDGKTAWEFMMEVLDDPMYDCVGI
jgi:hypothetical protein